MAVVYLVVENDWESNIVLGASLDRARAEKLRGDIEQTARAKRPKRSFSSAWSIDVEEVELS